jgi:hypothetical protein
MLRRLSFYDVCDYLSRLSPDLAQRVYRKEIYSPATDLETAKRIKDGWPFPHFSSPRTLGMRLDKEERIYLWGWSASATSREPWWSPYIWEMDSADGSLRRKVVETDPMSGGDNRMGGAVADVGLPAVTVEENGNLVFQRASDGGFSGVIHFSGSINRRDMKTQQSLGSVKTAPCAWSVDLETLPKGHVLALGRSNGSVQWTPDGWQQGETNENPQAWLRIYSPKLQNIFSTAIRGVVPFQIAPLSEKRFLIIGESRGKLNKTKANADGTVEVTTEDNPGVAITKSALFEKPRGKSDGYFMLVEWKGPLGPPDAPETPPAPQF